MSAAAIRRAKPATRTASHSRQRTQPTQPTHRAPQPTKFCMGCGKSNLEVTFRTPDAFKCNDCIGEVKEKKRDYVRKYQRDRSEALKQLIEMYPEDFERLMEGERRKREQGKKG